MEHLPPSKRPASYNSLIPLKRNRLGACAPSRFSFHSPLFMVAPVIDADPKPLHEPLVVGSRPRKLRVLPPGFLRANEVVATPFADGHDSFGTFEVLKHVRSPISPHITLSEMEFKSNNERRPSFIFNSHQSRIPKPYSQQRLRRYSYFGA